LQRCSRIKALEKLHDVAESLRYLDGLAAEPVSALQTLSAACQRIWSSRELLLAQHGAELDPSNERQIRIDLSEVAARWADLQIKLANAASRNEIYRRSLQLLADTEAIAGPSALAAHQRAVYIRALGDARLGPPGSSLPALPDPYAAGRVAL